MAALAVAGAFVTLFIVVVGLLVLGSSGTASAGRDPGRVAEDTDVIDDDDDRPKAPTARPVATATSTPSPTTTTRRPTSPSATARTTSTPPTTTTTPIATLEPPTRPVEPPTSPVTPLVTPPSEPTVKPPAVGPPAVDLWSTGTCEVLTTERDLSAYRAARGRGSARRLRGKVVILNLRLKTPGASWSRAAELKVEQAVLATHRFYLAEAERHGVRDLTLEMPSWSLDVTVDLPYLRMNTANMLDDDTMKRVRLASIAAIERGLGEKITRTLSKYRAQGYAEVGFLVHLPTSTNARPFHWSGIRGDGVDFADTAFLFTSNVDLPALAALTSHEGLHIFGADDIYRMRFDDPADRDDIMNDYCTGFRRTRVGDMTAYGVGWRNAPPARAYGLVDR